MSSVVSKVSQPFLFNGLTNFFLFLLQLCSLVERRLLYSTLLLTIRLNKVNSVLVDCKILEEIKRKVVFIFPIEMGDKDVKELMTGRL